MLVLFGLVSASPALAVPYELGGEVSRGGNHPARLMDAQTGVRFAFDMDLAAERTGERGGSDAFNSIAVSNLSLLLDDQTYEQSRTPLVLIKDTLKRDRLIIKGSLQSVRPGKAEPIRYRILLEDSTGTALNSPEFLSGNLDPAAFTKAVWSVNLGKGKKLEGDIISLSRLNSVPTDSQVNSVPAEQIAGLTYNEGSGGTDSGNGTTPVRVPEPASMVLLGLGLVGLYYTTRRSG